MGKWNQNPPPDKGELEGVSQKTNSSDVTLPIPPLSRRERDQKPKVIVYCHTPIRYYWSHYEEYKNMMEFGIWNPLAKFMLELLIGWLRRLDYEAAQRVDVFIANSRTTQKRIQKYYNRESVVIYP
jgi:Glycosyltransferase Family 4